MKRIVKDWIYKNNLLSFLKMISIPIDYKFNYDDKHYIIENIKKHKFSRDSYYIIELDNIDKFIVKISHEDGSNVYEINIVMKKKYLSSVQMAFNFCQNFTVIE